LINLDNIKSRGALALLRKYEGKNPYLIKLKSTLVNKGKVALTVNQTKYINKFYNVDPLLINRVVEISSLLGESLKEQNNLTFTPERILVQFMLADQEKTFHIYGKLKQNQKKSQMYWLPKSLVLGDPYFEECDINVDWDKYTELDTLNRTPYDHQKSGVEFLLCRKGAILADDMGLGKCLSVNELTYTPTGKVKMGDLKVGDYVIGSNGKKTKVLEVHPQPKKEMYKITFNDGYSTTCCKEHMWTVTSNNGSVNNKNRPIRYTNLTIEQMLDKDLELEQRGFGWNEKRPYKFKTYYKQSNGQNKWQIPIVKPIEFENNFTLPINPYLLGVSLGDGHIKKNGSILIELDENDFDEIFNNQMLNEIRGGLGKRRNSINILKEEIKALNLNGTLSDTKFIPYGYKYSSIEDRLSILQGLMDTDGHCMKSKNGNFTGTEYCSVSEQLTDDVAEIVHSLGGIVRKSSKIGSYKKPDGTKVMCKKAYRLNIKLPEGMNPFRLKRKADEYNTPKKYKVGRYISDITPIGEGESVCIKVDAEDSLFTINHGIVTHNTYQSIIAALECDAKKILIVCPSSMKITWEREIACFEEQSVIISGSRWPDHIPRFTIINFDILRNFHTIGPQTLDDDGNKNPHYRNLVEQNYDLIIVDEAHKVKDHKSQRGKIINEIRLDYGINTCWLLTGTPIANRPMDFYNLLNLTKAPVADNWKFFAKRYCDGKSFYQTMKNGKKKLRWITTGASNLDELSVRTKNILLRRLKTEVLDMPDKTITTHYHSLSKRAVKEYEGLWDDYVEKRAEEGKRKISVLSKDIVELGLLRKFIAMESIPNTIELAENALEQGQKVVIFTTFTDELEELAENFGKKCVVHNGRMSANEKQKSVDKFQNTKKTKVFIGNILSAGVGITLTEGTVVIFNSFDWVPGNNEQAEDRCYRIGQENNVSVYYQLFKNTVSIPMWYTIMGKMDVINQILGKGGEDAERLGSLINELEDNGLTLE